MNRIDQIWYWMLGERQLAMVWVIYMRVMGYSLMVEHWTSTGSHATWSVCLFREQASLENSIIVCIIMILFVSEMGGCGEENLGVPDDHQTKGCGAWMNTVCLQDNDPPN